MQIVEAEIPDFAEIKETLKSLSISSSTALQVDSIQVKSVRATISRLHGETFLRFTTRKNGTGILVWRLADAVKEEEINS